MSHPQPHELHRSGGTWRRAVAATVALGAGLAFSLLATSPATAAAAAEESVGYVRLAHLSPDTPKVDVYLSKLDDASFKEQVFKHVGYGVMSNYLALPIGTYRVAMRLEGQAPSVPPTLTTQVTVDSGNAYTVAGVGKYSGLGLTVLTDDLTRPTDDKAKVRIIQASVASPILDVSLTDGTSIATGVNFASTTSYQVVDPGLWTLRLKPNGSSAVSTLSATLTAGSVYSLLVLDGPSGLKLELRADARGGATTPDGGIEAGAGGTAGSNVLPMVAVGLGVVIILLVIALRMRRMASRRS